MGAMTGTRFFRHGELPLVILALLTRRSMNAYQLLSEIESTFAGAYEPSTGAIYPAVSALRGEGLIAENGGGSAGMYGLTVKGRRALANRREDLGGLEVRTGVRLVRDDSVDAVWDGFIGRARPLSIAVDRDDLAALFEGVISNLAMLADKGRGGTHA